MDTINFGETSTIGPNIVRAVLRKLVAENTVYDNASGVYYEPFILDGRVGYRVASNRPGIGAETFLYFNPTDDADDGVPNVFVYQGEENDPGFDGCESFHIVVENVGYQPGETPTEGAEAEHAAWVADHCPHADVRRPLPADNVYRCNKCGAAVMTRYEEASNQ